MQVPYGRWRSASFTACSFCSLLERVRSGAPLCPACSGAAVAAGHDGCALACQTPISGTRSGCLGNTRRHLNCPCRQPSITRNDTSRRLSRARARISSRAPLQARRSCHDRCDAAAAAGRAVILPACHHRPPTAERSIHHRRCGRLLPTEGRCAPSCWPGPRWPAGLVGGQASRAASLRPRCSSARPGTPSTWSRAREACGSARYRPW